ncbi:MAG: TonB-dependent receptor [Bacteriovoracaceae bacterium]
MLWLLLSLIISVQAKTLEGTLIEKGTRKKLSDVNVFVLPHKLSATTDANGKFLIENVPEGEFTWVVNYSGYVKYEQKDNTDNPISLLYLEKVYYKVYETTVTAKSKKRDDVTQTLTQEDFLMMPGAGYDPVKAVQNLTGVAQTQGAQVVIQGSSPDDTKYMVNQHEIPLVFHFGGLSSVVMPNAVESVDYLSAGFGPEYGRAIGGLIGLNTRTPKTDRYHGLAYLDIFNSGALVEGPINKNKNQSFLFSIRRSYIGAVLSKVLEGRDEFNFTVAPTYSDLTAIYDYKINDKNHFKLDVIGSKDELKFVLNKPIDNDPGLRGDFYQKTEFFRFIPRYVHDLSAKSQLDVSAAAGEDRILIQLNKQFLNIKQKQITTRTEYRNEISPKYKLFVGTDSRSSWNDVSVNLPKIYSVGGVNDPFSSGSKAVTTIHSTNGEYAAYVRNEIKPSAESPWTFAPNLRLERFWITKDYMVSPRGNIRYQYSDSLTLRLASGLYYQPTLPQERDKDFGNPDLKPPKSVHLSTGFSKDFRAGSSNGFIWNSSVFYKQLSNLVIPSSKLVSRNGGTTTENYNNEGKGRIHGLENSVKYSYQDLRLTLAYTLLKSTRIEPGVSRHSSEYDQTHNVNVIGSYEKGKWTYSTRLRYVTGNPSTPITSSYYDADNNVYVPVRGPIYSSRVDDFIQLDLRFDRKFIFDQWLLFAYLDIQNLTNHKNVQQINYSYDYSQSQPTTGLPIIPTFGFRGEF